MAGNGTMQGWSTVGVGCPPPTPISDYQNAAERWYRAKENLGKALDAANEASARLQQAQGEEQAAWTALESVAGRGELCANPIPMR